MGGLWQADSINCLAGVLKAASYPRGASASAEANPILAGAVIRLFRPTSLRDHMLCVVMNGNAPAGIGRLIAGHVVGPTGRPLMGDLWRVESINFLSRVL